MIDYSGRYVRLISSDGDYIIVDNYDYRRRYKKMARAFINETRYEGKVFYKHIILTQKKESYKPNILNPFFVKFRRYYGNITYIHVNEIQEERFEKTGEAVLHWHIIVGFRYFDFGKEDVLRVQLYWKYGIVEIVPIRKLNLAYIMKYVNKTLSDFDNRLQGIRRISMSRVHSIYRLSRKKIEEILSLTPNLLHLKWFKCNNKGLYYEYKDGVFPNKQKEYVYLFTTWKIVETYHELSPLYQPC